MEQPQTGQRDAHFKTTFGRVLRELRLERQLSQEALAEAAGYHVNHISFLERGLRSPNLLVVFDLAAALKLSTAELIDRVEAALEATTPERALTVDDGSTLTAARRVRRRKR